MRCIINSQLFLTVFVLALLKPWAQQRPGLPPGITNRELLQSSLSPHVYAVVQNPRLG